MARHVRQVPPAQAAGRLPRHHRAVGRGARKLPGVVRTSGGSRLKTNNSTSHQKSIWESKNGVPSMAERFVGGGCKHCISPTGHSSSFRTQKNKQCRRRYNSLASLLSPCFMVFGFGVRTFVAHVHREAKRTKVHVASCLVLLIMSEAVGLCLLL